MTLTDYAKECHQANIKWWLNLEAPCTFCQTTGCPACDGNGYMKKDRNLGEMLMLCVSELAEALEGHRRNKMDDHLPNRKMAEVELADYLIRMFDLAEGRKWDLNEYENAKLVDLSSFSMEETATGCIPDNFGECLLHLVRNTTEIAEFTCGHADCLGGAASDVIMETLILGRKAGFDLQAAYTEKMLYNKSRIDHQLATRLAEGGKRY